MDFRLQEASLAFISLRPEEGGVEKTMALAWEREGGLVLTLRFDLLLT